MRAPLLTIGAGLVGAIGLAGAAYAAHGGDPRLVGTAAAIALVHAPAILAAALSASRTRTLPLAALLWIVGVVLFSGDLFGRVLLGVTVPTAPYGGSLLILGWLIAGLSGFRIRTR